jgi:preprotein translocase subunit SecA
MAGRGTDIIMGGNPEPMAWARLKDKYPSRLDVPEDEWKRLVEEIASKEKMREEGRQVVEMGGLHILGTERHDARRIDNQLRGRAGRQGDPGSSRFYLSLQDDLMRIFAGEWVGNLLGRLGMQEGEAIESRMVSRRIAAAQKKVEERHFDSRKHLLEYDEVMDHQRKEVYGRRQRILEDSNCKLLLLDMLDRQIGRAVDRCMDPKYGAANFAEFAANRMGVEYEPSDFLRSDFTEAERYAHEKALAAVETQVVDAIEENLGAEDSKEWNWQALANQVSARWGVKVGDRQLKQMGKDNLDVYLREEATKAVAAIDLGEGKAFLEPDYGIRSVCDWARLKFSIKLTQEELADKNPEEVKKILRQKVRELYRQKEIEFPVRAAMARYMSDRPQALAPGGQRYNREGLYHWAQVRFPGALGKMTEEDFRTQSRHKLQEMLTEVSRSVYPAKDEEAINEKLEEAFEGTTLSEPADAKELAEWAKAEMGLDVPEAVLTGVTREKAQQELWNAFDARYRPEMRGMERGLLLNQLDSTWKNHLHTMDYLRSGIGLVGYAQEDPKTAYKREGMKEFRTMWDNMEDKVTDTIFRMEETEAFQESLWVIGATVHESAPRAVASSENGITNAASDKKPEPIRNRGQKVGRNDPCPCGSGKKYKACHMRQTV